MDLETKDKRLYRDEQNHLRKTKKRWEKEWESCIAEATARSFSKQGMDILQAQINKMISETMEKEKENLLLTREAQDARKEMHRWKEEAEKLETCCDRLKVLCQELQKRNKDIVDRSRTAIEEEERRRKEQSESFSKIVLDVQKTVKDSEEERMKQGERNLQLRDELNQIRHDYEANLSKMGEELEEKSKSVGKLATKFAEACALADRWKSEAEEQSRLHVQALEREKNATTVIGEYRVKFEEIQNTMSTSTKAFHNFQQETIVLSNKLDKALEENLELKALAKRLKTDLDKNRLALASTEAERRCAMENCSKIHLENERLQKQKEKLESLCRLLRGNTDS